MSKSKKYIFFLNVDFDNINTIDSIELVSEPKEKMTKITDLEILNSPKTVSFLDEFKTLKKCSLSMIDFRNKYKHSNRCIYHCFWDRHPIPQNYKSIGCPIRYIPSRAVKTYNSFISKEKYCITEQITESRRHKIETDEKTELNVEAGGYYETDGIFCSFNCCLAYITAKGNSRNPLYKNSKMLLYQMYNEVVEQKNFCELMSAPHWRLLKSYGGRLSIEEFRDSFDKIRYDDKGSILVKEYARLFEEHIRL